MGTPRHALPRAAEQDRNDPAARGGRWKASRLRPRAHPRYGLAHIHKSGETWAADTWVTGPKIGEIESVSVLPDYRNQGIGTRLFDRLEQELADAGATDLILGTLPGNAAAIRMYERRGFQSTWLYMSRFAGRPEPRNR